MSLEASLPEIAEIDDADTRENVRTAWQIAIDESDYASVDEVPRSTALVSDPDLLVDHVRETTRYTILCVDELLANKNIDIDRDVAIAGALVHDISKPVELSNKLDGDFDELFPHPTYGLHIVADVGLSEQVQHIVVSHSPFSQAEPQMIEAEIVRLADLLSLHSIYWEHTGELSSVDR
jgi:putative nucleotidyltransferase with HDIG domain